jgi:hypothetical protein
VLAILREALPLVDSASPRSGSPVDRGLWKHRGDKTSPDSAAKVEAWERVVQHGAAGGKETWALRKSVHEDRPESGTASWAEFERCFRDEHAEAEAAFTPNVIATHEALVWDCAGIPTAQEDGRTWGGFRLKVEEMRHKIGKPLKDRTFPVLQLTADVQGGHEFVVVSIPVPDFGSSGSSKLAGERGAQIASYVSVERIMKLADGGIEWLMATASDAGGVLPQFVQNMAMPGVVWKDVPLFLSWIAKARQSRDVARDGVVDKDHQRQARAPAAAPTAPGESTGGAPGTGAEDSPGAAAAPQIIQAPEVSHATTP